MSQYLPTQVHDSFWVYALEQHLTAQFPNQDGKLFCPLLLQTALLLCPNLKNPLIHSATQRTGLLETWDLTSLAKKDF